MEPDTAVLVLACEDIVGKLVMTCELLVLPFAGSSSVAFGILNLLGRPAIALQGPAASPSPVVVAAACRVRAPCHSLPVALWLVPAEFLIFVGRCNSDMCSIHELNT